MKLEQQWLELTAGSDQVTPSTREATGITLRSWDAFLRERHDGRADRPKVGDLGEYKRRLLTEVSERTGKPRKSSTVGTMMKRVVSFYSTLADAYPESSWVDLHTRFKAVKTPKQRSSASGYEPYPLELLPEILDAAKECDERYNNEAYPLVAGFLYSGMRAQMYGIKVSEIHFDNRINDPRVKGGYKVKLPMHKRLAEIWKKHLDTRDYDSPFLFRFGRYPYKYVDDPGGEGVWSNDTKASSCNRDHVRHILGKVEEVLKERGVEEHLMSHRFRKSVGTYLSQYSHLASPPIDLKDRRIFLTHKAKNITDDYDLRDFKASRDRYDQGFDFGSQEWVRFAQNGGHVSVADREDNGNVVEELRTWINGRALTAQDKLDMMGVIQEA